MAPFFKLCVSFTFENNNLLYYYAASSGKKLPLLAA